LENILKTKKHLENSYTETANNEIEKYLSSNKKVMDEKTEKGYLKSISEFLEIEMN